MKKLLPLLILLFGTIETQASHVAGAEITYKYIGDSTGIPFHYKVNLNIFRRNETGSAGLGNTFTVNISSSCYSTQNITVYRLTPPPGMSSGDGGVVFYPPVDCTDWQNPGSNYMNLSLHTYTAAVVLPGKCSDYIFSWSLCCRNNNITNLLTKPSLYVHALLNNMPGPNSSPKFNNWPIINQCLNKPGYNDFSASSKYGDSLTYEPEHPKSSAIDTIPYSSGYSLQQPITTTTGVQFDSTSGLMSFTPIQLENDVVRVKVRQYALDTADTTMKLVGSVTRDIQLQILANCRPPGDTNITITNSANIATNATIDCGDSIIRLKLSVPVMTDSITATGSEFRILDGRGVPIPVVAARPGNVQLTGVFTNEILIEVDKPFAYNDTLSLMIKNGSDGNTLVAACETRVRPDTVTLLVTACTTFFNLNELQNIDGIIAYPNPVKEVLTISAQHGTADLLSIQVIDVFGKEVRNGVINSTSGNDFQLNVESLPQGIYLVKVSQSGRQPALLKMIKE